MAATPRGNGETVRHFPFDLNLA
ncbi:protein of unknown function (plasmid) [Azospirillum baldaniorum]|uniref:Uncharacterized protein n=1 Tax=Azospirillum baldaniorum TaxID=1064539 RepID=A0A9P1JXH1_9PROT|nr:protein of unknown function [Azospirillum baldaniorum]